MRLWDQIRLRARSLWKGKRVEGELDEEFQFHLERMVELKTASGMAAEEARTAALRELGGVSQLKEQCRDARGLNPVDRLAQDVRYGLRMIRRNPAFSLVAILSLGLGIGANTAIFTLIHALILKPLPVARPQELVRLVLETPRGQQGSLSYYALEFFRAQAELFSGVFVQSGQRLDVELGGPPASIEGALVSGEYFSTLGVSPLIGRTIGTADDQPSGGPDGPIALLSYRFWVARFAADPSVVGRSLVVQGAPVRIAGVLPAAFSGIEVGQSPDVYLPLQLEPLLRRQQSALHERAAWWLDIIARRRPGISDAQLQSGLDVLWPRLLSDVLPRRNGQINAGFRNLRLTTVDGSRGVSRLRRQFTDPLYILMGIVGVVLLIACANVANLLLARTSARQREVAVRLALGASRARLLRQLLTESILLSALGAAMGLVFAVWGCRFLLSLLSGAASSVYLNIWPDPAIFGFTAVVAVATGILFGTGPALRATKGNTATALKESAQSAARRPFGSSALVVSQVALCMLLLIGAGLFVRTFWNLMNQDLGYDRHNLYVTHIDPRPGGFEGDALSRLYAQLQANLNRHAGVESASLSLTTPIAECCWFENITAEGYQEQSGQRPNVFLNQVSPGFFTTFGVPLLLGRDFLPHDSPGAPLVAIISESVAKRYFAGSSPIGRHISVVNDRQHENAEIIGVVGDMRTRGLRAGTEYEAYFHLFQNPRPGNMIVEVRAASGPAAATILREEIHGFDKQIPVHVESLREQIDRDAVRDRVTAVMAGFFGVLALLLASIGLYGIMSYTVIRRTGELGIRMALGARASDVSWMILRQALVLAATGAAIGIPAALLCAHLVTSFSTLLFGLKAGDPETIAMVTGMLVGLAGLAGYLPARRAARMDPMRALRNE